MSASACTRSMPDFVRERVSRWRIKFKFKFCVTSEPSARERTAILPCSEVNVIGACGAVTACAGH